MAFLLKEPNSPFWYLRFRNPAGKWVKKSTGLRTDKPKETLQARQLRAQWEARELGTKAPGRVNLDWVDPYFVQSLPSKSSLVRYRNAWEWCLSYLTHHHMTLEQLTYPRAQEFLEWREKQSRRSGKTWARNTILLELRVFSNVLTEAVRRGIIQANPFFRLRLAKARTRKKPEITPDEIATIEQALLQEPEWMRDAWLIAKCTGCRLSETRIPVECLDLDAEIPTITWPTPKGGQEFAFSAPCPTELMPRLREIIRSGRSHTVDLPFQPSRKWQHFLGKINLRHITFHCLRVTKVTRLRREGVPREVAMRLVNHSDELVHQLYDRHKVTDLAAYRDSGIAHGERKPPEPAPTGDAATPRNPTKKPGRKSSGSQAPPTTP